MYPPPPPQGTYLHFQTKIIPLRTAHAYKCILLSLPLPYSLAVVLEMTAVVGQGQNFVYPLKNFSSGPQSRLSYSRPPPYKKFCMQHWTVQKASSIHTSILVTEDTSYIRPTFNPVAISLVDGHLEPLLTDAGPDCEKVGSAAKEYEKNTTNIKELSKRFDNSNFKNVNNAENFKMATTTTTPWHKPENKDNSITDHRFISETQKVLQFPTFSARKFPSFRKYFSDRRRAITFFLMQPCFPNGDDQINDRTLHVT